MKSCNISVIKILLAKTSTIGRVRSSGLDLILYEGGEMTGREKVVKEVGSINKNSSIHFPRARKLVTVNDNLTHYEQRTG